MLAHCQTSRGNECILSVFLVAFYYLKLCQTCIYLCTLQDLEENIEISMVGYLRPLPLAVREQL